jgi:hypothetical protein
MFCPLNNLMYTKPIKTFTCPSDPSHNNGLVADPGGGNFSWGAGNYAFNSIIGATGGPGDNGFFQTTPPTPDGNGFSPYGAASIPASIPDGLSNTILATEKYALCQSKLSQGISAAQGVSGNYGGSFWAFCAQSSPTLAAPMHLPLAVYPGFQIGYFAAPTLNPNAIGPGSKFQVQPTPFSGPNSVCDPTIANSPHTGAINAVLCDGSARSISSGVSGTTWWWACTPAGGEVLGSDW